MTTLAEAKEKVRELSRKALEVADDPHRDLPRKNAALTKIEAEIKTWTAEVEALEGFEVKQKAFMAAGGDNLGNSPGYRSAQRAAYGELDLAEAGLHTKAAPPIRLDRDIAREMFEAARARKSFAVDIQTKATDSTTIGPAGIPSYDMDPALARREPNRILDLIPSRPTGSPMVEYFVQTTKATAGVVAEGAVKPGSDLALPMQTARAAKIAGWVDVSDEALQDFAAFYSVVTNDLTAAVIDAENLEMLSGTGVAPRYITGMLVTTGILTRAFNSAAGGDTYALDTLDEAETDVRNGPAFAEISAWVMHPTTFSKIRRAKDGQGRYLLNPEPTADTAKTIWGKPVVLTTQAPTGQALGADFADACRGFIRDGIRVTMSNSTTDASGVSNFKKNVTTVLAEERVGMYVRRPAAVITVTGLPT